MTPRRVRLVAFALILAFQVGGPFYRQVLRGRSPVFKNWVMYRGVGRHLVEASFFEYRDGDRTVPVDRFAALGYDRRGAPEDVFRIVGVEGFSHMVDALCTRLGPDTDLRARARLAVAPGWRTLATGERNLCAVPPRPSA